MIVVIFAADDNDDDNDISFVPFIYSLYTKQYYTLRMLMSDALLSVCVMFSIPVMIFFFTVLV